VLQQAFERELARGLIAGITVEPGHSVVAIVGEGMAFRPGTAATFLKAMANSGINVRTIAQGSSERQISICVEKQDCTKALRAAHAALALSSTQLSIAVIGATGMVGKELLGQLAASKRVIDNPKMAGRTKILDDLRLNFKVTAAARSDGMRLSYDGLDCSAGAGKLMSDADKVTPTDLDALTRFLNEERQPSRDRLLGLAGRGRLLRALALARDPRHHRQQKGGLGRLHLLRRVQAHVALARAMVLRDDRPRLGPARAHDDQGHDAERRHRLQGARHLLRLHLVHAQ
jgi:hypothetical protein